MPFRKKGSPYWHYDFEIRGYRFFGSTKCRDERDAEEAEAARRIEATDLVAQFDREQRKPMTLGVACDRWWTEHGQHLAAAPSEQFHLTRIKAILGKRKFLHALRDDDVTQLVNARRKDLRRDGTDEDGKPIFRLVKPALVNRTTALLRRVMRRARDNWSVAITKEPVWKKHFLKEDKRPVRELRPSEEAALDHAEDFDFAELRRFGVITGLRRRAMLLTWPQVDFELAQIKVRMKGGEWRILPMTREIYEMLWRRRNHHKMWVFTYVADRTYTIPKTKEKRVKGERYPITYAGFGSHKARVWKKAGVDARIHDLRHTTGMRTLRRTGNLRLVQKLLGHSDVKTTATFYTDATIEDLRAGMETASRPAAEPAIEAPKLIEKKGDAPQ